MARGPLRAVAVTAVVFDVGGVLVDWDPRHLYRSLITDTAERERFLTEVCSPQWHAQHDLGASYDDTIPALVSSHPEWTAEIRAWSERFDEMYRGPIDGSVTLLRALHDAGVPLYASTNWGAASWQSARRRFPYLTLFRGALVSGEVGVAKPDPAFFALLTRRFGLDPPRTLYVEDDRANVSAAATAGFVTHAFSGAEGLEAALRRHHLLADTIAH